MSVAMVTQLAWLLYNRTVCFLRKSRTTISPFGQKKNHLLEAEMLHELMRQLFCEMQVTTYQSFISDSEPRAEGTLMITNWD